MMKKSKSCARLPMMLLPLAMVAMLCVTVSAKVGLVSDSDARKADYIFMEALRQRAAGHNDAYYELLKTAYDLNPSDRYLAKEEGTRTLLLLNGSDSAKTESQVALAKIRDYVKSAPEDMTAGMVYASLASHLGHPEEAIGTWGDMYVNNGRRTDIGMQYADALIASADSANVVAALNLLDTLERREGIAPDFSMRRMKIYDMRNDTASIKKEAMKLLASAPADVDIVTFLGRLYLELNSPDSALVFFNKVVDLDPSSGAAYYNRAAYFNHIGDSVGYDREVFQAMRQPDLDLEPKMDILKDYVIKLYKDSTQHERISGLFRQLIDQYPHEPEVRNLFADYLVAIEDYAGAAEQKSYELDINPSDSRGWMMLSSLYLQLPNEPKAKEAAVRGLYYFPEEVSLYELAASADLSSENLESALELLTKARSLVDSTDVEQLSSLSSQIGDVYYRLGKTDSMESYYEKAIYYNPLNLLALNNYAYYLSCIDDADLDKALSMIERVMMSRDDDPTSLDTYAWVLFKRKDFAKAREIIDKAMELSKTDSADILEHAGDIYFMGGNPDEAVKFWSRALELQPDSKLLRKKVKHKTFFYE